MSNKGTPSQPWSVQTNPGSVAQITPGAQGPSSKHYNNTRANSDIQSQPRAPSQPHFRKTLTF